MIYFLVFFGVWIGVAWKARAVKASVIASVGGGLLLAFFAMVPLIYLMGDGSKSTPAAPTQSVTPPVKDLPWRGEVKGWVYGKSPDEVIKALGTPVQTQESGTHKYWYYQGISRDPVTGKTDGRVQIVFDWLRVTDVNFY